MIWRREKYSVPTRIRSLYYPACGTVALPIMLTRPPKFYPQTGHENPAPATLPLEGNAVPTVQEAEWVPGPVWIHAENLLPTAGFNLQTAQLVASHYTHVMKVYRRRRGIAPP
jgi:hypothetical protein